MRPALPTALTSTPSAPPVAPQQPPKPPAPSPALKTAAPEATPRPPPDRAQQLAQELMQARQELSQRQAELRRLSAEQSALRARLGRGLSRVRELESALRAETELRQQAVELHNGTTAALRARIAELEDRLERAPAQPVRTNAKTTDGLRGIRGIGPAYQRALRERGIERVEQIAAWTEADVAEIAAKLKIRPERIRRENWVGQAQELLKARSD
jgi:predicted flap endonuclease-1-like 5' DNA nuclease